ncbi:hypothetical protein ACJX0J_030334, partial [Zea mays]
PIVGRVNGVSIRVFSSLPFALQLDDYMKRLTATGNLGLLVYPPKLSVITVSFGTRFLLDKGDILSLEKKGKICTMIYTITRQTLSILLDFMEIQK